MNIIRKSIGTILILGAAAAGCAGDAEPPVDPTPGQSPVVKSTTPPPGANRPGPAATAPGAIGPQAVPVPTPAPSDAKTATEAPKVEGPSQTDTSKPAGAAAKLSPDDIKAINELPKAEQDVALAQAVCPVSNENLGSMGKPLKVTAEGRTFYLCCDSCQKDLKANPKGVVAKLDKLKAGK
jgi:hypothetical protein